MSDNHGIGAAMAGGNPREGRQGADFYPTPDEVTEALLREVRFTGPVWEPACGDGAMVRVIQRHGLEVIGTDLVDRGMGGGVDFLGCRELLAPEIVTNPPFTLAERFIRHAHALGAETVALVLKSTYWHAGGRTGLFREHQPTMVYALNWRPDFLQKGAPTMECVWCVWRKGHWGATLFDVLERPVARPVLAPVSADLFGGLTA